MDLRACDSNKQLQLVRLRRRRRLHLLHLRNDVRAHNLRVDHLGTLRLWMVHPDDDSGLDEEVHWDPVDDEAGHALYDGDAGEDDPVCEPLRGVLREVVGGFHALEGHVGGVEEADEIRDELHSSDQRGDGADQSNGAQEKVCLGVPRLLFQRLHDLCDSSEYGDCVCTYIHVHVCFRL